MTTSAFATVQAAICAALNASPALAGGRIYPNRLSPIAAEEGSAIVVRYDDAQGDEMPIGSITWSVPFVIECYARAPAGVDPFDIADPLLCDVWMRLSAQTFATVGADIVLSPKIIWNADATDTSNACIQLSVTASINTASDTLQAQS